MVYVSDDGAKVLYGCYRIVTAIIQKYCNPEM